MFTQMSRQAQITVDPLMINIYFTTADGYLVQDHPDGSPFSSVYLPNLNYNSLNYDSATGTIYASGSGTIQAFSTTGGLALLWTFATPGDEPFNAPALADSTAGPTLFFVTQDGTLYSVDATTGTTNWTFSVSTALGGGGAKLDSATVIDPSGNVIYNDQSFGTVLIT
jgi:outer membrane protein assembly factor BamB